MGKFNGKGSYPQLQSMRARLRRASCMNDDSYDACDAREEEEPPPHPSQSTTTRPSGEQRPPQSWQQQHQQQQQQQRDGNDREPDEQLQSAFFTRLPAEVRRMIYEALWRSDNPLMKMHVHACCDGARLTTTPCQYAPAATYSTRDDEVDPMYV